MTEDKRNQISPIPANLKETLTDHQILALRRIEGFGWDLKFVRRVTTKPPIPVVSDPSGKTIGILEADGRLNLEHHLHIRP